MDNKLSELKAAAEKYSLTLNAHKENPKDADAVVAWDEATWEMSRLINNDEVNIIVALLAELEASKKSNAFLKEQLSQLANFNPDWDMLEACRESWREVSAALKEAETRLATPVRLPDVLFIKVSGSAVPVMHAQRVKERVRAAGFKYVGDEQ